MIKVLDTIKFRTTESSPLPGAQPNNFGLLFSSASSLGAYTTLYFTNTAGQTFDLTDANSGSINILYYTGSNVGDGTTKTYTWTKPTNLRLLKVICLGAGGGGASGMVYSKGSYSTTQAIGGGGGGGGGLTYTQFFAEELPNTVSITVGAGGAGGATRQGSNSILSFPETGSDGTPGGNTSFGGLVTAEGGNKGFAAILGGARLYPSWGGGVNNIPSRAPYSWFGVWGSPIAAGGSLYDGYGAGNASLDSIDSFNKEELNSTIRSGLLNSDNSVTNNLYAFITGSWLGAPQLAGGGGGQGGGYRFSPATKAYGVGGSGSGVVSYNGNVLSPTPGGLPTPYNNPFTDIRNTVATFTSMSQNGGNGVNNAGKDIITQLIQNFPLKGFTASYGLGSGGGGGGGGGSSSFGGAGGNGGLYGAGGGGGGMALATGSSAWSPVGGSGSSGLCVLVEYY